MEVTEKSCKRCGETKPLEAFSYHAKCKYGRNATCKACKSEEARSYYLANREKILERQKPGARAYERKKKYGISEEQFQEMLRESGGQCALGHEPEDGQLVIDHDHATGAVRGLLCRQCNWALGLMRDNPDRFRSAAVYLEEYKIGEVRLLARAASC